jgi:predicted cupin superfamily sugar epimerase
MTSRGQTDFSVRSRDLVQVPSRTSRPDGDTRRNCLTSIYWVPTAESPLLLLATNLSDHVHYYQGGKPFEYTIYNPETKSIQVIILGPDIMRGHVLQLAVQGGMWKCGRLLDQEAPEIPADYCIIAEAVAPGFDLHDFLFISPTALEAVDNPTVQKLLRPFLCEHKRGLALSTTEDQNKDFDGHYDKISS